MLLRLWVNKLCMVVADLMRIQIESELPFFLYVQYFGHGHCLWGIDLWQELTTNCIKFLIVSRL